MQVWKRAGMSDWQIERAIDEVNERIEAYNEERQRKGPRA
jgi:hypothetical protein